MRALAKGTRTPAVLRIRGPLNRESDGTLLQLVRPYEWFHLSIVDLTHLSPDSRFAAAMQMIRSETQKPQTLTPAIAGALIALAGFHVTGIILMDALSYVVALTTVAFVKVPPP